MRYASIAVLLGLAGCIGGDDDGGPVGPLDASVPLGDSSIPLADAGAPDTTLTDATPPDAPPSDASRADSSTTGVTIRVVKDEAPEPGVTVVFGDASGALVGTAITDAAGIVAKDLPAGSMVTAILTDGQGHDQLVTVVDVEAGDVITVVDAASAKGLLVSAVDSLPPSPPAGTQSYFVRACAAIAKGAGAPIPIDVDPRCTSKGLFPLVVEAWDAKGNVLASSVTRRIPFALDGGLDEASVHPLAATGAWAAGTPTATVRAASLPKADQINLVLHQIADGVPFSDFKPLDPTDPDAGTVTFDLTPGLADRIQGEVNLVTFAATGQMGTAIAVRGTLPIDAGVGELDLTTLLPPVTGATLEATTAARPTVAWTSDGGAPASGIDGVIVRLAFASPSAAGTWTLVVPPTATSVRVPEIPSSPIGVAIDGGTSFEPVPLVAFVESSNVVSYAEFRTFGAALPDTGYPDSTLMIPAMPDDGEIRVSVFSRSAL